MQWKQVICTVWKVSKCGVISGPFFPVFGLNTGKYGPEITPYLDTFHVVLSICYSEVNSYEISSIRYPCFTRVGNTIWLWIFNTGVEKLMLISQTLTFPTEIAICFIESPLNMILFHLKVLFVLKIFKFLSWLFGYVEKTTWLER